ncbi:DUF6088 family protein [Geminisphaera colitermitum]|uniref:DUF6088 family protein n=1 Tax=Geminisphaera colitermitum TaxID=1148786 RepID=UPI0005BE3422|nr:DUF6088 family protein [Geminisphaera colitermitum]
MGSHSQSTQTLVWDRIVQHGPGWSFTRASFVDLGTPTAVRLALLRLKKAGQIRPIARGVYDYPRTDPQLGTLSTSPDSVVQALRGRDAVRIQPTGAHAANLLGLSTQVPMRLVYQTDGSTRNVKLGRQIIQFRRTTPKNLATAGRISGLVIQALRQIGKSGVTDDVIQKLDAKLSDSDKAQLQADLAYAPQWMVPIFQRLARTPIQA